MMLTSAVRTRAELRLDDNILPSTAEFTLIARSLTSGSPFSGSRLVTGPIYHQWMAKMVWNNLRSDKMDRIEAILARADGQSGAIRIFHPAKRVPRGVAAGVNLSNWNPSTGASNVGQGSPWSDSTMFSDGFGWSEGSIFAAAGAAAKAGADTILIGGLTPSQALGIASGDLLEIGGYLYRATFDAPSDAQGFARVPIRPRLRYDIVSGDQIRLKDATSPFMFAEDQAGVEYHSRGLSGSFGATLMEIVPF
jgi:hypothetical protein